MLHCQEGSQEYGKTFGARARFACLGKDVLLVRLLGGVVCKIFRIIPSRRGTGSKHEARSEIYPRQLYFAVPKNAVGHLLQIRAPSASRIRRFLIVGWNPCAHDRSHTQHSPESFRRMRDMSNCSQSLSGIYQRHCETAAQRTSRMRSRMRYLVYSC